MAAFNPGFGPGLNRRVRSTIGPSPRRLDHQPPNGYDPIPDPMDV